MKVKLDENVPDRLVSVLTHDGHDVDTVASERLKEIQMAKYGVPLDMKIGS